MSAANTAVVKRSGNIWPHLVEASKPLQHFSGDPSDRLWVGGFEEVVIILYHENNVPLRSGCFLKSLVKHSVAQFTTGQITRSCPVSLLIVNYLLLILPI